MLTSQGEAGARGPRTLPQAPQLMQPTLQAIDAAGGSATIQEITQRVVDALGLTEEQQAIPHKGGSRTELEYRLAWARTYLKLISAVENSGRGVWSITDRGRNLPEEELRQPTPESSEHRAHHVPPSLAAAQEADDDWKTQVLDVLAQMNPTAFERLAQRVLRESGFAKVEVRGRSGDGGIDGVGLLRVSLIGFRVVFQCKRYRGTVGPSYVRDLRGAMDGRADKALLITTGSFTADAKREASRDGAVPVELVDGDALCELLKTLSIGIRTSSRESIAVDQEFFSTC
jgi:restriction system protein